MSHVWLTNDFLGDEAVAIDRLIVFAFCTLVLSPELKSETTILLGSMDNGHEDLVWKTDSQQFALQVLDQFTDSTRERFTNGEVDLCTRAKFFELHVKDVVKSCVYREADLVVA